MKNKKFTVMEFKNAKMDSRKISVLTAYDYSMAKLLDTAGIDCILVGDSLGMVMLGYENTLQVTMEDMLHHTKAVSRGTKNAFVISDMPFMSYHTDVWTAVRNAGRFIQEVGADCVKIEGGKAMIDTIKAIVRAQIPVMGHLGLTPQSIHMFGGFKVQGKSISQAEQILEDALLLQEAGVCAIVLECVPAELATFVSERLDIPTIGIGAGAGCDGQVLVIQDVLGMYEDISPKFVKRFADLGTSIRGAVHDYMEFVEMGAFPEEKHGYAISPEIMSAMNEKYKIKK